MNPMDKGLMAANSRLTAELKEVVEALRALIDELYGHNPPPPSFEYARRLLTKYPEEKDE